MTLDEQYMTRCLQLAANGLGRTRPNPLVGCVIVKDGDVISEGYHRQYGGYHAERNAILDCREPQRIEGSTLYVNLEPCSHHGLTPPCADFVVEHKVARVVVCNDDPNPKVSGRGYGILEKAGIEVVRHVMEREGRFLNRRFFTFQEKHRPYVILKWAETTDGFMAPSDTSKPYWITNTYLRQLSHRWRTEEAAILVGSETYLADRPQLNARLWKGLDPQPVVLDRSGRLDDVPSHWLRLSCSNITDVLTTLYDKQIQSVIVEGGRRALDAFLSAGLWDEIRLLRGSCCFGHGLESPRVSIRPHHMETYGNDTVGYYYNN